MSGVRAGAVKPDETGMRGGIPWWFRERDIIETGERMGISLIQDYMLDGMLIAHGVCWGRNIVCEHTNPTGAVLLVVGEIKEMLLGGKNGTGRR